MSNTRTDRLPLALAFAFRLPLFLFNRQESRSLLDGESPSSPQPSSRSARRSPKKGRLFGPGNLAQTAEEEQQDLDPPETTGHDSGPTLAPAAVEEESGDEQKMVISVSGSPPHETKMRQISEGVHGIEMKKTDQADDDHVVTPTPFPTTEDAEDDDKPPPDVVEPRATTNDPVAPDVAQSDTSASSAESSAVNDEPPAPLDRPKRASTDYLLPFPSSRRGSDSSGEQEKGLKRKFGDRAVSESREAESIGKKASKKDITDAATTSAAGTKRTRDEEDKDQNPKEAKRPSPPPEKTVKTVTEDPPVASSSKMVGVCISTSNGLII